MPDMNKFGIIGCGNMGGAMLRQALKAGVLAPEDVIVADANPSVRASLQNELKVNVTYENKKAAACSRLLLAVKPQFIQAVCDEIAPIVNDKTLILSIVAGYDLKTLHTLLKNDKAHIVRVMPNTPAMVGEGVLAASRDQNVTDEDWAFSMRLLSCMGLAEEVPERLMDTVTGLSGSSPAFAFLFLEALADAGVRGGLPRDMAQRFAAQVLIGSGKLAQETKKHPGQLKDMVTSPAGTTIEGVAALEKNGFRYAVMDAVNAAIEKSKSFRKD